MLLAEARLALEVRGNHDGRFEDSLLVAVGEIRVRLVKGDNVGEINPEGRFECNVLVVKGGEGLMGNDEVIESVLSSLCNEEKTRESRREDRLEEHGGPATWSVVRKQL